MDKRTGRQEHKKDGGPCAVKHPQGCDVLRVSPDNMGVDILFNGSYTKATNQQLNYEM